LYTPWNDPALVWRTATKPPILGNVDEAVHPGFRRQRQRDVLLAVKRPSLVVRENEPGPSVLVIFERIIAVDDVSTSKIGAPSSVTVRPRRWGAARWARVPAKTSRLLYRVAR
jgi:hypothetical protein